MFHHIILMIFFPALIIALPYSIISQAQLMTSESNTIWLYNQSSWSQCMCAALRYQSSSIATFNCFHSNQSCQLIPNKFSSSTSFYLTSSLNSSVFLLTVDVINKLKSICCSDISWLMNRIQQSETFRNTSITKPVGLVLDTDLNMLIVTGGSPRAIQQRELTGNMTGGKRLFTKMNAQPISYYRGFYYVGIYPPAASSSNYFYVYNINLTRIYDMPFPQGDPQRAVWLYNNSIMCIIIHSNQSSSLTFLNWHSSSFSFTYNRTVVVPFDKPYGLAKSNDDTMIYVSGNSSTIYQLSTTTFLWSILVSNGSSKEIAMSLFVDSCGTRLWVLILGFGIRVYDRMSGTELASWNMSTSYPTLYDMALTSDYELYLIDYSSNQLIHYGLSLEEQCTLN